MFGNSTILECTTQSKWLISWIFKPTQSFVPQGKHHQLMTTLVTLSWIYLCWLCKPIIFQPKNIRLYVIQIGGNLYHFHWWCVDSGTCVRMKLLSVKGKTLNELYFLHVETYLVRYVSFTLNSSLTFSWILYFLLQIIFQKKINLIHNIINYVH